MDLNYEILQYYAYKKVIKRRQVKGIYEDCTRLQMPVENYMIAKGYCTQVTALAALGESAVTSTVSPRLRAAAGMASTSSALLNVMVASTLMPGSRPSVSSMRMVTG